MASTILCLPTAERAMFDDNLRLHILQEFHALQPLDERGVFYREQLVEEVLEELGADAMVRLSEEYFDDELYLDSYWDSEEEAFQRCEFELYQGERPQRDLPDWLDAFDSQAHIARDEDGQLLWLSVYPHLDGFDGPGSPGIIYRAQERFEELRLEPPR